MYATQEEEEELKNHLNISEVNNNKFSVKLSFTKWCCDRIQH